MKNPKAYFPPFPTQNSSLIAPFSTISAYFPLIICYLVDPAYFFFLLNHNRILLPLDNFVEVFVELFETGGVAQLDVVFKQQDLLRLRARGTEAAGKGVLRCKG